MTNDQKIGMGGVYFNLSLVSSIGRIPKNEGGSYFCITCDGSFISLQFKSIEEAETERAELVKKWKAL